jgi:NAD(P)-dependent dehydrogenase (short-subunit alcohol dehydrogenase family)
MPKVALVTGSSRGIGRATALRLAADGYDLVVNYVNSEKQATQVVVAIKAKGRKAVSVKADVSKWREARRLVEKAIKTFGRIDVLVNNAGIYKRTVLDKLTPEQWDRRVATNLSSVFYCTKAALPYLKKAGWGRIINISSQIAIKGTDHGSEYAASKAGILGFTKAAAQELAKYNVTVNAIAPGPVDTDILAGDMPEKKRQRAREIPLRRIGKPEDIAAVVSFLASKDSDWITGTTLLVNGGSVMY